MRRRSPVGFIVLVLFSLLPSSMAFAQIARVSVASDGTQANGASDSPGISADGRFVVFGSVASNLVAGDTNGLSDVFLRDRDPDADGVFEGAGGATTVRLPIGGPQPDAASFSPRITPDGRYVAFLSSATNLLSGMTLTPATPRAYRFDRQTGALILVSIGQSGQPGGECAGLEMSDDGQVIVMTCSDPTLVTGDPGFGGSVLVRDVAAGTTARISEPQPPPDTSVPRRLVTHAVTSPTISGDGRIVGFVELTSNRPGIFPPSLSGLVTLVDRVSGVARRGIVSATQFRLLPDGTAGVVFNAEFGIGQVSRLHLPSGTTLTAREWVRQLFDQSADGRSVVVDGFLYELETGVFTSFAPEASGGALARSGRVLAFASAGPLVPGDTNAAADIFVTDLTVLLDADGDTLDDRWETFFRLSTSSGTGDDGPAGDPDGDGLTNAEEQAAGSHPRGTFRRYLAEGASSSFFRTRLSVANPDPVEDAAVVLRFEQPGGASVSQPLSVVHGERVTREAGTVIGLAATDFAAFVESDRSVGVDRLMTWDATRYGSHAESAVVTPSTTWHLAEGTTVLDFQLFYLLLNPQASATTATVRYLLPGGAPLVRTYELPPHSRTTIYVNTVPSLAQTDVSAEITATQPIVVERAMYRNREGQPFALGHAAAAVPQASTTWFLAEGATGSFFDTYVLVSNPSAQAASVQVDFLLDAGLPVTRTYVVGANSRFGVYVDGVPGMEGASFGTRVTSTVPVVVERAMYWAGGFFDYYEGHASAGVTATGSHWVLAEGETGGPDGAETYVLLANTGPTPLTVRLTILRDQPWLLNIPTPRDITIQPDARVSVPLSSIVLESGTVSGLVRAGVDVRELGASPSGTLVVEGAIYWNAGGQLWGAGASLPATRMP